MIILRYFDNILFLQTCMEKKLLNIVYNYNGKRCPVFDKSLITVYFMELIHGNQFWRHDNVHL